MTNEMTKRELLAELQKSLRKTEELQRSLQKTQQLVYLILKDNGVSEEEVFENEIKKRITNCLQNQMGIPCNLKGFKYIREAVWMTIIDKYGGLTITKRIYPDIAQKFDTNSSSVERAIRNAIKVAWTRGNIEFINELFGHSVSKYKIMATNAEVITTIAEKIRMELNLK